MALRLVRQTSETPNITNKDDTIMTRYAYGGYNGIVKAFGQECNYTTDNGIFKVLDGRIVIDGWEIEIDGAGWLLNLSNVSGTQYHTVYAEINVSIEAVKLGSSYNTGSYPTIDKGDDLTQIPNGTARLLLYNVKVENGLITEVVQKFELIPYLSEKISDIEKRLTRLGFRQGVAQYYNFSGGYTLSNSLKKQGKYVIFYFKSAGLTERVTSPQIIIPEGFRPKLNTRVSCEIILGQAGVSSNIGSYTEVTIKANGEIELLPYNGSDIYYRNINILNVGWEVE
jgi:hypothetical protein